MKKYIILVLALTSFSAFAGSWANPSKVTVSYAHTAHGGYGVFRLEDMSVNPDGCSNPVYYVVSKQSNPVFEEIYSLLLAAHMSNKTVHVWLNGCSPHNHPVIQHARVLD
ncbi:MAG: hypothetical protein HWE27_10550 [Gammaproteobacteria bacterium]|nr:hypothetical protein [Gammaproteobacteria bacterium]